jgi:hypothetical protein
VQDSGSAAQGSQQTVTKTLSITINVAPIPLQIVTNSPLPSGTINVVYFTALTGNGGTTPYTWGLKSGSPALPPGLTLDTATGFIQGTPTQTSNLTPTFKLTDAAGTTVEKALNITISAVPLSITTNSLPQGTANQNYSATLVASGGTGAYTWGLAGGSPALPNGLTLNPSTGVISGIPTSTSSLTYTFTVTDQTPPTPQTATKTLQLIIGAAPPTLTITTNSLPSGTVLQSYNFTLTASGGTGTITWDIVSGSLPAGFSPLSSSGVISGTPTSTGTTSATFRVRDSGNPQQTATKPLSITVGLPAAPTITTTTLPNATFNVPYNQTLGITGGTPPFVWGVISGTLPAGLTITSNQISFTPSATGSFTFTVRVTDATNQFDDQQLTLNIIAPPPPTINAFTLPTGTVNQPYPNTQLTATGGALPYTWSVNPALPNGLSLNPSSGVINGTPLSGSNGVTSHTFTVADSTVPINQTNSTAPKSLTINANVTPVTITTTSLSSGTVGQSYTAPLLAASGGTSPYNWSFTTPLPPGLSLGANGAITGMPTTPGTTSTIFKVLDSTVPNQQSATKSLSITINAAPPPLTIATTTLPTGTVGQAYNAQLQGSGGTPAYQWSVAPSLPANLQLDQSTGAITGIPSAASSASFIFTLQDNASQSVQKSLTLTINAAPLPLTITTTSPLPAGKVNDDYGTVTPAAPVILTASGGTPPYTWSAVVTPALPAGLTFDATTATISGIPTASELATLHTFTVQDNSVNPPVTKALSLTIAP